MSTTLVADIGGTNTRLAIASRTGRPEHIHAFPNDSVSDLVGAIDAYVAHMGRIDRRPDGAVLAVAGPVQGRNIVLTNRDWKIDLDAIQQQFKLRYVRALNDFEALAWALPWFEPEDVHQLGPALPVRNGTKAVLGPGTGLGVSALIPDGHSWFALATEAGHMSFGPAAEDEWEVFARIAEEVPFVSAETILSGPGLERLYRAANPGRPGRTAKAIGTAALAGTPLRSQRSNCSCACSPASLATSRSASRPWAGSMWRAALRPSSMPASTQSCFARRSSGTLRTRICWRNPHFSHPLRRAGPIWLRRLRRARRRRVLSLYRMMIILNKE